MSPLWEVAVYRRDDRAGCGVCLVSALPKRNRDCIKEPMSRNLRLILFFKGKRIEKRAIEPFVCDGSIFLY